MDLGGEFCLVCGADPPLFSDRMCEKCTRDRVTLVRVPKNVPWTRCARCGIIDFQGKWSHVDEEDLWHELVQRNVEFHTEIEDLELGLMAQEVDGRHTLIGSESCRLVALIGTVEFLSRDSSATVVTFAGAGNVRRAPTLWALLYHTVLRGSCRCQNINGNLYSG